MLKLLVDVPANIESYNQHGTAGKTSQGPSLNCSTGLIAQPGTAERAEIIKKLLYDFRTEINCPYIVDDDVALKDLRLHVTQCFLEICLRRELASQGDEASYFIQNPIDLAVIGHIMANLTYNNASNVIVNSSNFEDSIRVVSKLLRKKRNNHNHLRRRLENYTERRRISYPNDRRHGAHFESVRHAFYNDGTGQVSVSLKKVNNERDVELLVADNGCGPQKISFGRGLHLVARVSAFVLGDITIRQKTCGGTDVSFRFPAATAR